MVSVSISVSNLHIPGSQSQSKYQKLHIPESQYQSVWYRKNRYLLVLEIMCLVEACWWKALWQKEHILIVALLTALHPAIKLLLGASYSQSKTKSLTIASTIMQSKIAIFGTGKTVKS